MQRRLFVMLLNKVLTSSYRYGIVHYPELPR